MGGSEWSALIGEQKPGNVYLSSSEARAVLQGRLTAFVLLVVVRPMTIQSMHLSLRLRRL